MATDDFPNKVYVDDWELLSQVSQVYRSLSDEFMDQIGMHRAQATLLCRLYLRDGLTQSEIGEQLAVQGATVTNIIQRVEEAGLVTRRRDVNDNRLVRVYLTPLGREKEHAITEQFMNLQGTIFEGIDDNKRTLLRQLLKQMLQNMTS
ncbi:MAG: MarR family transcriptional regulator [Chloroflexi bacterium]|nr:MarR family transcriptional regulator [Chloroflexota bacterium]